MNHCFTKSCLVTSFLHFLLHQIGLTAKRIIPGSFYWPLELSSEDVRMGRLFQSDLSIQFF